MPRLFDQWPAYPGKELRNCPASSSKSLSLLITAARKSQNIDNAHAVVGSRCNPAAAARHFL